MDRDKLKWVGNIVISAERAFCKLFSLSESETSQHMDYVYNEIGSTWGLHPNTIKVICKG
jgi:hypothetical protein